MAGGPGGDGGGRHRRAASAAAHGAAGGATSSGGASPGGGASGRHGGAHAGGGGAEAHPALSLRGLTRRFGSLTAVDGLTFDVAPGELFGLVGPDGAGKTTALRMLAGVLPPSAGDAEILGHGVARDPERVKHDLAYMSQRFGLYGDLTVAENLEFYADLYRVPRAERPARLERLYRFSNLAPFRDRLAGKLSGGMKQKLGLSCALIHEPRVLLLDEPTFGVDPVSRRDLWLIVHEMVARGVTAVVSTAYMDEAERFDRLAMLHRGRVVALDTPAALQRSLAGRLLAVRPDRLRDALAVAEELPAVRRAAIFGEWLHLSVGDAEAAAPAVESALRARGIGVAERRAIEPSLEDVFMEREAEAVAAERAAASAAGASPAVAGAAPAATGPAPTGGAGGSRRGARS